MTTKTTAHAEHVPAPMPGTLTTGSHVDTAVCATCTGPILNGGVMTDGWIHYDDPKPCTHCGTVIGTGCAHCRPDSVLGA